MKIAIVAAALMLSGCATLGGTGVSEPASVTIKALADAGCKGGFSITFGGGTGQLGGGFQASNTFTGSCDPASVQHGTNITGGPTGPANPPAPPNG